MFKVNTEGTDYRVLKSFSDNDGAYPDEDLEVADGVAHGAAGGDIFEDEHGRQRLLVASGLPLDYISFSAVTLVGNILYGVVAGSGAGSIFKMDIDGNRYPSLKSFANGDGATPGEGLVFSNGTLYGTTYYSDYGIGPAGLGVVYKVNTNWDRFCCSKKFEPGPRRTLSGSGRYRAAR